MTASSLARMTAAALKKHPNYFSPWSADVRSPVTNPRGGTGSHHSSLLEDGGQLGKLLDGGLGLGVLVQRHLHLALLGLEHHGPDLVSEVAGLGGGTPRLLGPDMILLFIYEL